MSLQSGLSEDNNKPMSDSDDGYSKDLVITSLTCIRLSIHLLLTSAKQGMFISINQSVKKHLVDLVATDTAGTTEKAIEGLRERTEYVPQL